MTRKTITVALTGASGLPYGLRLIEILLAAGARYGCCTRRPPKWWPNRKCS
ncbi:aromatic acid decarboxylase [Chromobacterium violaceum]|uniref:Aromatic acid decarboxylase n=1 Tax=Chromobacterium violaceum TaxID=536 RepID=A0A447THT6_CHRVL|nr:aromatic acid decarboxylase [Chromobacterium violaceum]